MSGAAPPRLRTDIWVRAQLRLCDVNSIPAVIIRKGDPDAGSVLLKLNRLEGGCEVLSRVQEADGTLGWMRATGDSPVAEGEADEYIRRRVDFDPDIWVVEIEDPKRRYALDGMDFTEQQTGG